MHELAFPPDIQREMAAMWREIQGHDNDRETKAAKADPATHKLSTVFEGRGGTNYRYWPAGPDGRGRKIRFCYSSHRNVAGYFLSWREIVSRKQIKRDQWAARKRRKDADALAKRRAEKFKNRPKQGWKPGTPSAGQLLAGTWYEQATTDGAADGHVRTGGKYLA